MSEKKKTDNKSEECSIEKGNCSIRLDTGSIGVFAVILIIVSGVTMRIASKNYEKKITAIKAQYRISPRVTSKKIKHLRKRMRVMSKELEFEKKNGQNQLKRLILAKETVENKKEQIALLRKDIANNGEQIRLLYEAQENKNGEIQLLRASNEKLIQKCRFKKKKKK